MRGGVLDLSGSGYREGEHRNEHSDSIKCEEFF